MPTLCVPEPVWFQAQAYCLYPGFRPRLTGAHFRAQYLIPLHRTPCRMAALRYGRSRLPEFAPYTGRSGGRENHRHNSVEHPTSNPSPRAQRSPPWSIRPMAYEIAKVPSYGRRAGQRHVASTSSLVVAFARQNPSSTRGLPARAGLRQIGRLTAGKKPQRLASTCSKLSVQSTGSEPT